MCFRFLVNFLLIALVLADDCDLPSGLVDEIHGYQDVVDQIIDAVVDGKYSNRFYDDLADFVDTYGNRIAGKAEIGRGTQTDGTQRMPADIAKMTRNIYMPHK